ncbi:MAG: GNAT family N-acetyltransferase [Candidatus Lokiarchaeota archaeon]|nr:GNAT family N-acetyltransferase [Candidatus Lokiarchaeota archaeon]
MPIRELKVEDIETIVQFWWDLQQINYGFDERYYELTSKEDALAYKKEYYEAMMGNPFFFPIVIETDEGKVIGYMITEIKEREPFYKAAKIARIREVFLLPESQGKGYFSTAYQKIMQFLKEHKIELIDAEIDLSNPALAKYYKVNLYKRAFRLICWVSDTEDYFKKKEEKKIRKQKK